MSNEHLDRVDQTLNDAGVDKLLADVAALSNKLGLQSGGSLQKMDDPYKKEPAELPPLVSASTGERWETLDSGAREEYESGMVRDTAEGKPRYDLIPIMPLRRVAELYERGARKYDARNWEQASSPEELERFKASAWRHFVQWANEETDEDHGAAVVFNIFAWMFTKAKLCPES